MTVPLPADASDPGHWEPDPVALAAFTAREFLCHHCGAEGTESRGTDQVQGLVRFRVGAGRLLLPFCPACGLDHGRRREAERSLQRAVRHSEVAWVDPVPLSAHTCPLPACSRPVWYHLGLPLPCPVVTDPFLAWPHLEWHPCPWCVAEDPGTAVDEQRRRARAIVDLSQWEAELR